MGRCKMGKKIIYIAIILSIVIFNYYQFRWIELEKVFRKPNGEYFYFEKIEKEDRLCYIKELIDYNYNFIIRNKGIIYIRYHNKNSLEKLDELANLTTDAEELKILNENNNRNQCYIIDE